MLTQAKIGVPRDTTGMLFFGEDGFKAIKARSGEHEDISLMRPIDAVDEYCRRYGGRNFRLGLATDRNIGIMRDSIGESVFDLHAESILI